MVTGTPSATLESTPAGVAPTITPIPSTRRRTPDPPEARALWSEYLTTRSQAARDELVRIYYGMAVALAGKYGLGRSVNDQDDLLSEAGMGLLHAVETFDPSRGVPFAGFASRVVSNRCMDALRKCNTRAFPRHHQRQVIALRLKADLGRKPTGDEITKALNAMPLEDLPGSVMHADHGGENYLFPARVDAKARVRFFAELAESCGLTFEESLLVFLVEFHSYGVTEAGRLVGYGSREASRRALQRAKSILRELADRAEWFADCRQLQRAGMPATIRQGGDGQGD